MYIKDTGHYVKDAPIRKVAGSDYLYGENGKIEDIFCEIEGFAAGIIKRYVPMSSYLKASKIKSFYTYSLPFQKLGQKRLQIILPKFLMTM